MHPNPSGWLVIDKPAGINSTRVVTIVRKLLNTRKVGHAGTLDPFASGILPIAVGEATKTVAYAQQGIKEYHFTVRFGEARDTDDKDGQIVAESAVIPSKEAILAAIPSFIGEIDQVPPRYSAIKVAGKRSYDLARQGSEHVLPARKVQVHDLALLGMSEDGVEAHFTMVCGKGTYVRSIARDLASSLGAYAYVSVLRRARVGKFFLNQAISLDKLEEMVHNLPQSEYLLSVDAVLDDIPVCIIPSESASHLRQGKKVLFPEAAVYTGVIRAVSAGELVAFCTEEEGYLKPVRVFNN